MSGTSIDGVDSALVDVTGSGHDLRISLKAFGTIPFAPRIRALILDAVQRGTASELSHLNVVIGELFARGALHLLEQNHLSPSDVDLIGSHGQTIYHRPKSTREPGVGRIRSTFQIGEPAVIAERTGITTIANFRARDVAAGGHGAPLAPYMHFVTFRDASASRVIVNLGGIANVTYLPRNATLDRILAFDTGPCNMVLDGIVSHMTEGKRHFDQGGRLARSGQIHDELLREFLRHPYFRKKPPKTTGREEFGSSFVLSLIGRSHKWRLRGADLLATVCRGIAVSLYQATRRGGMAIDEVIAGGGGAANPVLMDHLSNVFHPRPVRIMDQLGWNSKAYEAMAFAVLAYQTWQGVCANVPSATGAPRPVILGSITPGKPGRWRT